MELFLFLLLQCVCVFVQRLPHRRATPIDATDYGSLGVSASTQGITFFNGTFAVPPLPISYGNQSIFLWFGIEPQGYNLGVLQPVLMYGPDCASKNGIGYPSDPNYSKNPYWYWSAQYVFPNETTGLCCVCAGGAVYKTSPGNTLLSTLTYDLAKGWIVSMQDLQSNQISTLVTLPFMDPSNSWQNYSAKTYSYNVVETYNVENSKVASEMPPTNAWKTTSEGANNGNVYSPVWVVTQGNKNNANCDKSGNCLFNLELSNNYSIVYEEKGGTVLD